MIEKIDQLMALWICLIIFNALFPVIEYLAELSDMLLVDAFVLITKILLEPSPITFIVWGLTAIAYACNVVIKIFLKQFYVVFSGYLNLAYSVD